MYLREEAGCPVPQVSAAQRPAPKDGIETYKTKAWRQLKPNSCTCNFVEVSGHNLESPQTWGFRIQCLHYKPVSNDFCSQLRPRIRPLATFLLPGKIHRKHETESRHESWNFRYLKKREHLLIFHVRSFFQRAPKILRQCTEHVILNNYIWHLQTIAQKKLLTISVHLNLVEGGGRSVPHNLVILSIDVIHGYF
jgi:hypothetical protein